MDAADAGEVQQVVDQHLHAVGAVDREVDVLVGPFVELPAVAALEQLGEAGHLAQRFLEVVRGDVRELLQLGVGALEVGRLGVEAQPGLLAEVQLAHQAAAHALELAAEPPQVGRADRSDGVAEVAVGDGAGVGPQPLQGRGDAAAERFEDDHGEHDDEARDGGEDRVAQAHRGRQIGPRPDPLLTEPVLLGGHGRPDPVEVLLPRGGAPARLGRGRSGGCGGDGTGDLRLPGPDLVLHGLQVAQGGGVAAQQFHQPGGVDLLVGDALAVGGEEVRCAGEAVAADAGLLVEDGRFEADRGGQRGRPDVDEIAAEGGRPPEDPGSRHPEQAEDGQRHRHSHLKPPPGRPGGRPPRVRQPLVAGHPVTPPS